MAHVYENHMGGVYFSEDYDDSLLETCEQCFDSDQYLGFAEDKKNVISDVKRRIICRRLH